ncbi:hypothetical protein JXA80_01375, partial [bacterium]|nr:hypothetical protein [candidate division CSSED10-310 bacterium]
MMNRILIDQFSVLPCIMAMVFATILSSCSSDRMQEIPPLRVMHLIDPDADYPLWPHSTHGESAHQSHLAPECYPDGLIRAAVDHVRHRAAVLTPDRPFDRSIPSDSPRELRFWWATVSGSTAHSA